MKTFALRLHPGQDLKQGLVAFSRRPDPETGYDELVVTHKD